MWTLPGLGTKPVSPVLASWFLTTGPPGKSCDLASSSVFCRLCSCYVQQWVCPSVLCTLPVECLCISNSARNELIICFSAMMVWKYTCKLFDTFPFKRWGLMPCPWTRGGINHSLLMSGIGRKDVWDLRVVKNIVASSLLSLGSPGVGEDVCHNWRVFKPPVERRQETEVCQQPAVTCQPCDLNSSELLSQSSLQMVQPQLKYNPAKLLLDSSPTETLRW